MVRYHLGAVVVKVRIEGLSGSVGRVVAGVKHLDIFERDADEIC